MGPNRFAGRTQANAHWRLAMNRSIDQNLVEFGNRPDRSPRPTRVLILGGGFGGAYAARRLGRTLGKRSDVEVVLISRENYLLFTPMLHEVAAGDLYPPDIVEPLRKWLRRIR